MGLDDLEGASVGLVGFGVIGQAVAARLAPFGSRVAYATRSRCSPAIEARLGAAWLPLPRLLQTLTIVSLHLPLIRGRTASSGRRLWDIADPAAAPVVLEGFEGRYYDVAISPGGDVLAYGSRDGAVRLWDVSDPAAAPMVLEGHDGDVSAVAFRPDGTVLASGGLDGAVSLWDLIDPGAVPLVLERREGDAYDLAFAFYGQLLASSGADGTVRLWARVEALAELVGTHVWSNLTLDEWRQFAGVSEQVSYQPTCPNLPPGDGLAIAAKARPAAGPHSENRPIHRQPWTRAESC